MTRTAAAALAALCFAATPGHASDRAASIAVGAVAGAVVLGPVGAIGGAAIGYLIGPSTGSRPPRSPRSAAGDRRTGSAAPAPIPSTARAAARPAAAPKNPPNAPADGKTPPMQGFW
jgi:hypothetical protein